MRMIILGRPKIFGLLSLFLTMIRKTTEDIWIVKQLRFTRAQIIRLYFEYKFEVAIQEWTKYFTTYGSSYPTHMSGLVNFSNI